MRVLRYDLLTEHCVVMLESEANSAQIDKTQYDP